MTCIVAVRGKDGSVIMGGDSMGADGWDRMTIAEPKVFRLGDYAIGYTSSFRMGQLLGFSMEAPAPPKKRADLARFMRREFTDAVRSTLKAGGWIKITDAKEDAGSFLVAVRGRVFNFGDELYSVESAEPFDSVGCGRAYALGALRALHDVPVSMNARQRCEAALKVAVRSSTGVSAPFHFVSTEP